jgi:hypothetical protein
MEHNKRIGARAARGISIALAIAAVATGCDGSGQISQPTQNVDQAKRAVTALGTCACTIHYNSCSRGGVDIGGCDGPDVHNNVAQENCFDHANIYNCSWTPNPVCPGGTCWMTCYYPNGVGSDFCSAVSDLDVNATACSNAGLYPVVQACY